MTPNTRPVLFSAIAIAVISGLIAFAIARSVDSQESRNPEIGLSDQERQATHTAGGATSIASSSASNRTLVDSNPSVRDMPRVYGSGEPLGVGYKTVADLAANPSTNVIARGRVISQRLALGDADANYLVVISTLTAPAELKGILGATQEVSTPVGVSSGNGFRLGISDAYGLPETGDDVIMFLQAPTKDGLLLVLPWGTYIVRSDATIALPEGGSDQLRVIGTSAVQFLADIDDGVKRVSEE